jgi:hypothetical protein
VPFIIYVVPSGLFRKPGKSLPETFGIMVKEPIMKFAYISFMQACHDLPVKEILVNCLRIIFLKRNKLIFLAV